MLKRDDRRKNRWYFGGLGGAGAVCITHPLDLLKVQLQTVKQKTTVIQITKHIIRENGIAGMYSGLSASLFRQLIYTTTRFGIYEILKQNAAPQTGPTTIMASIYMSLVAGIAGGIVGNPGDVINVRLQNDIRLPVEKRRNYKHVFDGLIKITKEEGVSALFNGVTIATVRACLITVTQLTTYDHIKEYFLSRLAMKDDYKTHFLSSTSAAAVSLFATQPFDVVKTRVMNARPGEYKNYLHAFQSVAKQGPQAFYKGVVPSFLRLGPQTILTFLFMEQLRLYFGFYPSGMNGKEENKEKSK